jgi:hypothetical protein
MIPFDMTIGVRGHASLQQEPPLSPVQTIGRGGRVLLELAVRHGGFWVKKCGQRHFFVKLWEIWWWEKCNTLVPTYVLPDP